MGASGITVKERKIALSKLERAGDSMIIKNKKVITANWWIKWYHEMPVGTMQEISRIQRAYKFKAEQIGPDVKIWRIK